MDIKVLELPAYIQDTQICHQWETKGSQENCNSYGGNGEANGIDCAKMGGQTRRYADVIQYDDGGCNQQWQLRVPSGAPHWLKQTRLCFKWKGIYRGSVKTAYLTKDENTPCSNNDYKGKDEYKVCAKSGEWTNPFNDNANYYRGERCDLQWMIEVTDPKV